MHLKRVCGAMALCLGSLASTAATAHGVAQARHGGQVQMAHDLGFELVLQPEGASLYLLDHDQAMPSKGISGKLMVLQGTRKLEVPLQEAGENRLSATGVKLAPGDKVVAVLGPVAGKTVTVRFSVK